MEEQPHVSGFRLGQRIGLHQAQIKGPYLASPQDKHAAGLLFHPASTSKSGYSDRPWRSPLSVFPLIFGIYNIFSCAPLAKIDYMPPSSTALEA
jgi:hypothetical protein